MAGFGSGWCKQLAVLCDDCQGVVGGVPGQAGGAAGQQPLLQALALVYVPHHNRLVAGASCRQVQACVCGRAATAGKTSLPAGVHSGKGKRPLLAGKAGGKQSAENRHGKKQRRAGQGKSLRRHIKAAQKDPRWRFPPFLLNATRLTAPVCWPPRAKATSQLMRSYSTTSPSVPGAASRAPPSGCQAAWLRAVELRSTWRVGSDVEGNLLEAGPGGGCGGSARTQALVAGVEKRQGQWAENRAARACTDWFRWQAEASAGACCHGRGSSMARTHPKHTTSRQLFHWSIRRPAPISLARGKQRVRRERAASGGLL